MIYSKQALLDLVNKFPDDAQFAGVSFWERKDIEFGDWKKVDGEEVEITRGFTDKEWELFASWLYRHQDLSWDFDEAQSYALSNGKADN